MKRVLFALFGMLALAGVASAATNVTANITTNTTWDLAGSPYNLRDVISVTNGATLTIEPGVTVIGYTDVELGQADSSALVITRGCKIMAVGTPTNPIIFTSSHDTGTWRPVNAEWGNLTMLGNAIVADGTFTSGIQDGTCYDNMEGLPVSPLSEYGGTDDDDNSGVLQYVQLRFGGSIIGTANELNGLSLGGIGRETVFDYVEIMNNVDDGVEIWGGTAQMKHISIWNIGDDTFDLDEGYRGKAQFVLIVQGGSSGTQGSGIGDNCFEMDGAENPDNMQPYANPQLYNFTVIGEPNVGDQGFAFRDNMRIQMGNSVIMDVGDKLFSMEGAFDQLMDDMFTTPHDTYVATGVDFSGLPYDSMDDFYSPSRSGNWTTFDNCIFYNYNAPGAAAAGGDPVDLGSDIHNNTINKAGNLDDPTGAGPSPITTLGRTPGGPGGMALVTSLDPRAAGPAAASTTATAPNDGFFTPVNYIGAFGPDTNWLKGWSASDAFGFLTGPANPVVDETISLTKTVFFQTVAGVVYEVQEAAAPNGPWSRFALVTGDGTINALTDLEDFDTAKFYRVIRQQ